MVVDFSYSEPAEANSKADRSHFDDKEYSAVVVFLLCLAPNMTTPIQASAVSTD